MREFARTPVRRTLLLGLVSFALVVASLGIDQTAYSQRGSRHLGFGYPLHFAFSDFSGYYYAYGPPQTFGLNPWEIPVEGNPLAFLVSWLLVYGVLLSCWLVARSGLVLVVHHVREGPFR